MNEQQLADNKFRSDMENALHQNRSLTMIAQTIWELAKAYADAQVEASVARQQPIFEAAMKAKDAEIAQLKAETHNHELRIDSDAEELDRRYEERSLLIAEIKRLREALERVMRHRVDESKSSIDNYCEIKDIARVAWKAEPAPVTLSALPDKCTCVYSFLGVLAKQCRPCKESRFLAPVTEVPKENENGLLPCPFCGGKAELKYDQITAWEVMIGVGCRDCQLGFNQLSNAVDKVNDSAVIKYQWNKRA